MQSSRDSVHEPTRFAANAGQDQPGRDPSRRLQVGLRLPGTLESGTTGFAYLAQSARGGGSERVFEEIDRAPLAPGPNRVALGLDGYRLGTELCVVVGLPGHVPQFLSIATAVAVDGAIDLGSVEPIVAPDLCVRLRGPDGPVAAGRVIVRSQNLVKSDGEWLVEGMSDAIGRATLSLPIGPGQHEFAVEADGFALAEGSVAPEIDGDGEDVTLDLVRGSTWTGQLVELQSGAVLDGLVVRAVASDPAAPLSAQARSDRRGRFHLELPLRVRSVRIAVEVGGAELDLGEFPPGNGLTLRCAIREVRMRVVDGGSGAPIRHVGLRLFPASLAPGHGQRSVVHDRAADESGVIRFRVLDEPYVVQVIPLQRAFLPSSPIEIHPQQVEMADVVVERAVEFVVRTTGADGSPVSGVLVEAVAGDAWDLSTVLPRVPIIEPGWHDDFVWDAQSTDEAGVAALRVSGASVGLRVTAPSRPAVAIRQIPVRPGQRSYVAVELPVGATLAGRVGPMSSLGPGSSIVLLRQPDGLVFPREWTFRGGVTIQQGGSYQAVGIPAGTWDVHMAVSTEIDRRLLATVGLTDGETRVVDLALDPEDRVCSVRVAFRPLDDSIAWSRDALEKGQVVATLFRRSDDGLFDAPRARVELTPDAEWFDVELPAGLYQARMSFPSEERRRHPASAEWIPIGPDTREVRFTVADFVLRVRLIDAAGRPVVGARCEYRVGRFRRDLVTSGDGDLDLNVGPDDAGMLRVLSPLVAEFKLEPQTSGAARRELILK